MRKKRVLFCSEATFLNTGYATYTREILNYLHSTGKYELAEMASYGERNDPRAKDLKWKYYGVMPNQDAEPKASQEELNEYHSQPVNQFGEFIFERVCLDFLPDVVCDIRDFWMVDFIERSPFRPCFKWALMPTVDARPQARQWLSTYQSADACFTYSDWAGDVLKDQTGGQINHLGSAPPSAHPAYQPIQDKDKHKESFGIDPEYKIIGTVMRNQRRKLYPDLFEAFRNFLDQSEDKKYYLYCHTSYPDLGWNIPELLQEHGLASNVLFTYICKQTGKPFASLFKGAVAQSQHSGQYGAVLSNVKFGASYEQLSSIMNLFDLYVQYANSEGFGMPQVEAAACGVPVMGTDYSAMESVIRKLGGITIKPAALYKELETGCLRAVPDNGLATKEMLDFFKLPKEMRRQIGLETRKAFEKHYQWDISGNQWEKYFDSVDTEDSWKIPPRIHEPHPMPEQVPEEWTAENISNWLISSVLGEPERVNTYFGARLTRDLMYQTTTASTGGMYFNESSAAFDGIKHRSSFDIQEAYNQMHMICSKRNFWEQERAKVMGL
jgi:glycosyltransferase involved in cell wall biosynthesis